MIYCGQEGFAKGSSQHSVAWQLNLQLILLSLSYLSSAEARINLASIAE